MKTEKIHPLPWKWKGTCTVDSNGDTILSETDAANAFEPYLLIPKLLRDHPQPERDGRSYLVWLIDGYIVVLRNHTHYEGWSDRVAAWAGPIEPLEKADPFEEWYEKLDYETKNKASKSAFKVAYLAGKEAK